VTAVHQFVPTLAPRDAVGTHYLAVQAALREAGLRSEIYAFEAKDEFKRKARPFRSFRGGRRGEPTFLLYHSSIGSPVGDYVAARPEPVLVDYHNITPARFFQRYEPHVAGMMTLGRSQLLKLGARALLGLADSAYNARELDDLGYERTAVVPILLDIASLDVEPDPTVLARLQRDKDAGGIDLLFVGRIAPNKAQHDLVKVLHAYHRAFDGRARLRLVGGSSSEGYSCALREFVDALGLADRVDLAGPVPAAALAAYWATADVFVIASEHEGFCVPLLEAMHHRVPIVAYGTAAVPETLGDAGIALDTKLAAVFAEAVHRAATDTAVRDALVTAGERRLDDFAVHRSREALLTALMPVVGA
jgi:glycosyltransferase involved in cell wall biosynthesis